ncbi:MAG TPA: HIT domain-containing protein [Candidatus Limnocylindrales bacterium]|nr:HIT domain-containing protein [Candidatus Limnocylindrales bacterium]
METLWAPWRIEYILSDKKKGCLFCTALAEKEDEVHYVLYRGKHSFIMMNLYPYNNGHLMIIPYRHVPYLADLTQEEILDVFSEVQRCETILRKAFHPEGFNMGINIGAVAGAGVKDHIHVHIVPRWGGDTNYMTVIAEVRVIPEHIKSTYRTLLPYFHHDQV